MNTKDMRDLIALITDRNSSTLTVGTEGLEDHVIFVEAEDGSEFFIEVNPV